MIKRIQSQIYKNYYVLLRNFFRLFDVTVWPLMLLFSITLFVNFVQADSKVVAMVILGVTGWRAVYHMQIDITTSYMEEYWSHSLNHFIISPIKIFEFVIGNAITGFLKFLFVLTVYLIIGYYVWGFYLVNIPMFIFGIFVLCVFGIALGLISLGIISLILLMVGWVSAPLLKLVQRDFAMSVPLLRILLTGLPLFYLTSPLMWVLIIWKKQWQLSAIYALSLVFNFAANLIFIPIYGASAAAYVTIATEGVVLLSETIIIIKLLWKKTN